MSLLGPGENNWTGSLSRAQMDALIDPLVDKTLSALVLNFVSEPRRAVREMIRVTRPGGVVAAAVWVLLTPLRYAHSRLQERRADEFALALTGGAEAFSSAIRRLGARHLVDDRPSILTRWLFHRHPTLDERLVLAGEYQRRVKPV